MMRIFSAIDASLEQHWLYVPYFKVKKCYSRFHFHVLYYCQWLRMPKDLSIPRMSSKQSELWDIKSTSGNIRPFQIQTANIHFNWGPIFQFFSPIPNCDMFLRRFNYKLNMNLYLSWLYMLCVRFHGFCNQSWSYFIPIHWL